METQQPNSLVLSGPQINGIEELRKCIEGLDSMQSAGWGTPELTAERLELQDMVSQRLNAINLPDNL
jgi:hypothetical protein